MGVANVRAVLGLAGLSLAGLGLAGCPADSGDENGSEASSDAVDDTDAGSTGETNSPTSTDATTTAASSGASEGESTGDGGSSTSGDGGLPMPTDLPVPTGACPVLADGDVVFSPAGIPERTVRLWMSDAADELDGPLIYYWHGTGSSPSEASFGLTPAFIQAVVDAGGIVAAPTSDPGAGTFPWYLVTSQTQDDLVLADEILGCALDQVGVDTARIHSAGMSAGGLMTSQMSYRRSNYLASVVVYSGGFLSTTPPDADPANAFTALTFHGGPDDIVVISFLEATERYATAMGEAGRLAVVCDHGGGHSIPDARLTVGNFLSDHPYGVTSSYVDGLPDWLPDYCAQ